MLVSAAFQFSHQFFVGTVMAGRNHDESLYGTALKAFTVEFVQGIDENVNSLVSEFVPSAYADKDGVLRDGLCAHGGGNLHQALAGSLVEGVIGGVGGRRETVLKAVWRDNIHGTLQELGALLCGDIAHGCEYIGILGRFLLQRVDGGDVEAARHLITVVLGDVVVEREIVAGKAPSHHSGVGCERRCDGNLSLLEVKDAGARLPLVELGNHLLPALEVIIPETLYHAACDDPEYGRLLVIPVSGDGVYAEVIPQGSQDVIGLGEELLVIHEDCHRAAGDVPPPHAEAEALSESLRLPRAVEHRVFQKIRIVTSVHPDIRADENVAPAKL